MLLPRDILFDFRGCNPLKPRFPLDSAFTWIPPVLPQNPTKHTKKTGQVDTNLHTSLLTKKFCHMETRKNEKKAEKTAFCHLGLFEIAHLHCLDACQACQCMTSQSFKEITFSWNLKIEIHSDFLNRKIRLRIQSFGNCLESEITNLCHPLNHKLPLAIFQVPRRCLSSGLSTVHQQGSFSPQIILGFLKERKRRNVQCTVAQDQRFHPCSATSRGFRRDFCRHLLRAPRAPGGPRGGKGKL